MGMNLSCENHIRDNPFPINIYTYNFYHLGVGYLVGSAYLFLAHSEQYVVHSSMSE